MFKLFLSMFNDALCCFFGNYKQYLNNYGSWNLFPMYLYIIRDSWNDSNVNRLMDLDLVLYFSMTDFQNQFRVVLIYIAIFVNLT